MAEPLTPQQGQAVEKWYLRRGLTYVLQGTGLRSSWTSRAVPPLLVMFVIAMGLVAPAILTINVFQGLIISAVTLIAAWVVANLIRRRRPFAPVERIGWIESAIFVLAPTLVVLLTPTTKDFADSLGMSTFELRSFLAGLMLLWQLVVLATVLALVTSGILALSVFVTREMFHAASGSVAAMAAALPVLLGVVFFFFFNPGVWLVIATLDTLGYIGLIGLFVVLGGGFLGSRRQLDLDSLAHFDCTDDLKQALEGTPLADADVALEAPADAQLTTRQRANLRLVAVLSRLVIAAMLSFAVFAVFFVLGFLAIDPVIVQTWTKLKPHNLIDWHTGARHHIVSWEHLKVAGFLAVFAGFNYSLVSATDARLREGVNDSSTDLVRQAAALRLAILGPADDAHPASDPDVGDSAT